jgi:hypothetical protein
MASSARQQKTANYQCVTAYAGRFLFVLAGVVNTSDGLYLMKDILCSYLDERHPVQLSRQVFTRSGVQMKEVRL